MDTARLHRLNRRLRELMVRAGVGDGEPAPAHLVAVVEDVLRHPGTAAREIEQRTGVAQSMVSLALAELARADLITRERDPGDGRRMRIRLTGDAERLIKGRGARQVGQAARQLNPELTEGQAAEVEALLERLAELLDP